MARVLPHLFHSGQTPRLAEACRKELWPMLENQGTGMGQQFAEGTPVYDVDGDEVGHVSEHGIQDNCLVLHHGLLREDVYVPLSVIARNDADGVYLSVDKDDVLNRDWDAMQTEMAPGTT